MGGSEGGKGRGGDEVTSWSPSMVNPPLNGRAVIASGVELGGFRLLLESVGGTGEVGSVSWAMTGQGEHCRSLENRRRSRAFSSKVSTTSSFVALVTNMMLGQNATLIANKRRGARLAVAASKNETGSVLIDEVGWKHTETATIAKKNRNFVRKHPSQGNTIKRKAKITESASRLCTKKREPNMISWKRNFTVVRGSISRTLVPYRRHLDNRFHWITSHASPFKNFKLQISDSTVEVDRVQRTSSFVDERAVITGKERNSKLLPKNR
ncbi:hypothetical protein ARMSODRAFT_977523 [Armillaria solidipes]|uniref:Uncharacterized protein n=1 Tax=Armillaria solidipes TaxID=1076256 RepID=A0A2H3B6Y8_9AGAR|nr:hypothetical protein ARMSODRAFT_977523 [Armillaria solidipes]